jgi:hypothetical protein
LAPDLKWTSEVLTENGLGGLPWFLPPAVEGLVNPFCSWGGFPSLGHCLVKRDIE